MQRDMTGLLREALSRLEDHHIGPSLQKDIRAVLASAPAARPKADMLVNGGALQMALNVLKRGTAVQQEAAAELEKTARPAAPDFDPQAQVVGKPFTMYTVGDGGYAERWVVRKDARGLIEPVEGPWRVTFTSAEHANEYAAELAATSGEKP